MSDGIIDIEPIEDHPHTAALARIETGGALVRPAADLESIVSAFVGYQQIRDRLLNQTDYQTIQGRSFPKKSAWRKLAVAFGVDLTIKERVYERNEQGRIIRAEFIATATAPNGRHADGYGACDAFERCCMAGCKKGGYHKHCPAAKGDPCPGITHFSNSQHDIPATAETRAKNRAASDLFGFGEVSAEEMNAARDTGTFGGWDDDAELKAAMDHIKAQRELMTDAQKEQVRDWLAAHDYRGLPVAKDDYPALRGLVDQLAAENVEGGEPFDDSEKGGSTSSIHASASSGEATSGAGELNQLPGTTEPAGAA